MDPLQGLAEGFATLLEPTNLLLLVLGVLIGMLVGVMPGLGAPAGIAILLPLTFGLDATVALAMLAAIYYGSMYGGTITSVLINTPGEASAVATTFDGYPLARQGRAGPALVVAAIGSFFAGMVGVVLISTLAPVLAAGAATLGPSELFLIILLGLLTIVLIVGRNKLLGLISAALGFALATVGLDIQGAQRYTFGSPDLLDGVNFIAVAVGLFGIAEVFWSIYNGDHRRDVERVPLGFRSKGFWPSRRDWRDSSGAIVRGTAIGFGSGVLPGAGATLGSLLAYGFERAVSKQRALFGKGALPGVAAAESANNGASSGAMVPMLTLGMPGSGATAILLVGFIMWGIRPGPQMISQNPEVFWGLMVSMIIGNVLLLVLNLFAIPAFASVAQVPYRILAAVIVLLGVVGVYAESGSALDVWLMFGFGVLGFLMKRYGMSPAALTIALILGGMAERYLSQSLLISGGNLAIFLDRPISLTLVSMLIAGAIGATAYFFVRRRRMRSVPTRSHSETNS